MAKSKRSAALFEVIQASRLPKRQSPLVRWWFQRRAERPIPYQPAFPSPANNQAFAADQALDLSIPPPTVPMRNSYVHAREISVQEVPSREISGEGMPATENTAPAAPKQTIPGVDLQLDPDYQQITFKVSYYSAIVTGFTVLVVIGLAYAVGRKMNHGPIAASASPSSAQLQAQPAHPDVLDVAGISGETQPKPKTHSGDDAQLAAIKTPANPTPIPDNQRIIGRQYVVIQIYSDKKSADEAAALLIKNNLPCTVENGLAGWASKNWWCVVGTTGFDHIRGNPEYVRYETAVNRVSDQYAGNPKFKKFEPRAYRWKESTTEH